MTETVWLLDVDGVLNASRPGWSRAPRSAMAYAEGHGYRLRWEPALIDRIRDANNLDGVTVRWSTTWCVAPDQLTRTFGLNLECAFTERPPHLTFDELKVNAALGVLAAGHRLVWTDDSVVGPACARWPEFDKAVADGRAHLLAPKPSRGIRPNQMDDIWTFLTAK